MRVIGKANYFLGESFAKNSGECSLFTKKRRLTILMNEYKKIKEIIRLNSGSEYMSECISREVKK